MAIALLAGGNGHFAAQGNSGGTSGAGTIDTTGASLLILSTSYLQGVTPTVSDSKSNTWTPLTAQSITGGGATQIYYCANPSVGSSHTFSSVATGCYASLAVLALSGAATSSPFDQQNGFSDSGGAFSIQPGSVTPSENNEIVITSAEVISHGTARSIDSGFTISDQLGIIGGTNFDIALAYLIQTTAGAVNPTWSWGANSARAAAIATFKAGGGGTSPVGAYAAASSHFIGVL